MSRLSKVYLFLAILSVCTWTLVEYLSSDEFFQQIEEQGLLVTKQLQIEIKGEFGAAGSLRIADLGKLRELEDATLAAWVKNGLVGMMYTQNHSLANLDRFAARLIEA